MSDLIFIPSFLKIAKLEGRRAILYETIADLEKKIAENQTPYILLIFDQDYRDDLSVVKNASAALVVSFGCVFKQLRPFVFMVDGEKFDRFSLEYILAFIEISSDLYRKILEISQISISLTVEKEPDNLYNNILTFLRKATNAEAGTLYLMDKEHKKIFFISSQNSRLDSKIIEKREIPFDTGSLAGYVCYKGETLNIPDAYKISDSKPYKFNDLIDKKFNYKTVSIITVPMKTTTGNIVGAVQLINKIDVVENRPVPFSDFDEVLLKSLSTLAAVSVENNDLLLETETLLNNMIVSSVKAIEQRDPATKGHSVRVTAYTMALLKRIAERPDILGKFVIDKNALKTAEIAALLHDFGKVGVREKILMKESRFYPEQLDVLKWRLKFILVSIQDAEKINIIKELLEKLDSLNLPKPHDENEEKLVETASRLSFRINGEDVPVLTKDELACLTIKRGTLNDKERGDMEKHVVYSYELLSSIDWPFYLKRVPEIVSSHHEKLDGSGYPRHKKAAQLGIIERTLAIADIYDALTAKDRPYKKAIPPKRAISIIEEEVKNGKLDRDVFSILSEEQEKIDAEVDEKMRSGKSV